QHRRGGQTRLRARCAAAPSPDVALRRQRSARAGGPARAECAIPGASRTAGRTEPRLRAAGRGDGSGGFGRRHGRSDDPHARRATGGGGLSMRRGDQAEGLRKLFAHHAPSVLPILVPGGGQGALVANLAAGLTREGREVLLIDATPGELAMAFGLRARYELAHVVAGDKQLAQIVLQPYERLRIVPAARALKGATHLDPWLAALAARLDPAPELIIVYQPTATALLDGDLLVAAAPGRETLTRTYAELKRMKRGHGRLRLLVARAQDERGARTLHRALDETSQRYLGECIDWAGYVPNDASLRRAEAAARSVFDIDTASPSARALLALGRALE